MPRPMTSQERRLALARNRREALRVVKRALVAFALFAAAYYFGLLAKERKRETNASTDDLREEEKKD